MPSLGLPLYNLSPSTINKPPTNLNLYSPRRKLHYNSVKCSASSINGYDLYDLLGIDSSSDQSQIKKAYRSLQKRCHPDIAGPAGHDMAIILNDVYSLLSDPNSRSAYDREQLKSAEFQGYTGKPLYSTWFGSEGEHRAVFVDEIKCIGCLKCALFAENTFAVESVYGRARVIAQWADPEHKINDAIQACPVDCISMVERSKLGALEFLMSKQPRGNVRVGTGNTVGTRVSNIFADADKLESKFYEMKEKASNSKESDFQREARIAAMQAIRSISNLFYWKPPTTANSTSGTSLNLIHIARKTTQPNTDRLREAAAQRRARGNAGPTSRNPSNSAYHDTYWTPALILPPPVNHSKSTTTESRPVMPKVTEEASNVVTYKRWRNPMASKIPIVIGVFSAIVVRMEGGERMGDGVTEHIGGSIALEIINSSWLQVFLAGVTWYLIGIAIVGLVEALGFEKWGGRNQSER
ncbi:DNAJ heat shock N-terminal domain-containing protein [Tasmannia lanceolata]|uniref:DNAJ heat shock N-terminal domain-containing protein n=1 Tax=Tasmannia lanceolata TaxID=3420 RepID=UPI004063FF76